MIWIKDMAYHRMAGYIVGWSLEGYKPHAYRQWFADGEWYNEDKRRDKKKGIQWNPWSNLIVAISLLQETQEMLNKQGTSDIILAEIMKKQKIKSPLAIIEKCREYVDWQGIDGKF